MPCFAGRIPAHARPTLGSYEPKVGRYEPKVDS